MTRSVTASVRATLPLPPHWATSRPPGFKLRARRSKRRFRFLSWKKMMKWIFTWLLLTSSLVARGADVVRLEDMLASAAIGYAASAIDTPPETYANVARITLDALGAYADDVRAARQIKGGIPVKPAA